MERLYNWMCWMISSSNRSVMVSKSANVSIWKERDETGIEGAVAQVQALCASPFSSTKPQGMSWVCAHAWPSGCKLGFNIKKRSPQLGLSRLDWLWVPFSVGRQVPHFKERLWRLKEQTGKVLSTSKTFEMILFPLLHMSVPSPCRVHGLAQSRCQRKGKGLTTKRGAVRLTPRVRLLTILCAAPMFRGHETL